MQELTHEYLLNKLNYNPETGVFAWNISHNGTIVGKPVGSDRGNGYLAIRLLNKTYLLHRLAWFYVYAKWPDKCIDHIDNNRKNNRISNLRDVDRTLNNQNYRNAQTNSKTGVLGVRKCKDRFHANIGVNSKSIFLGSFPTLEQASEAYRLGKEKYHVGAVK